MPDQTDPTTDVILVDEPGPGLRRITLNRPGKRNALSPDLREGLLCALTEASVSPDVRCIIMAGAGGNFCAGGDLASLRDADPEMIRNRIHAGHLVVQQIAACGKPVIAQVEGYAMGAGAGLALAADVIVVGPSSNIGFPFIKVGLGPDFGVSFFLPRRVGNARACRYLLRGETVGGAQAVTAGLADELAAEGQVEARTIEVASEFCLLPREAIRTIKTQLSGLDTDEFREALSREIAGQAYFSAQDEFREGTQAFLEKRRPRF